MSRNYKFKDQDKPYFISFATVYWIDTFIRPVYKDILIESINYCVEKKDLIVYGHTHYPVVFSVQEQIILNPGSVGQTRDGKLGACWALWDTTEHTVTLQRSHYSTTGLVKQCRENDPEMTYLQTVLTR